MRKKTSTRTKTTSKKKSLSGGKLKKLQGGSGASTVAAEVKKALGE